MLYSFSFVSHFKQPSDWYVIVNLCIVSGINVFWNDAWGVNQYWKKETSSDLDFWLFNISFQVERISIKNKNHPKIWIVTVSTTPHILECSYKVLHDFQTPQNKGRWGRNQVRIFQNKLPTLITSKPQAKWHTKKIYEEQTALVWEGVHRSKLINLFFYNTVRQDLQSSSFSIQLAGSWGNVVLSPHFHSGPCIQVLSSEGMAGW